MIKNKKFKNTLILFVVNFGLVLSNNNNINDFYQNYINNNILKNNNLKCGIYDNLELVNDIYFSSTCYTNLLSSQTQNVEDNFLVNKIKNPQLKNNNYGIKLEKRDFIDDQNIGIDINEKIQENESSKLDIVNSGSMTLLDKIQIQKNNLCRIFDNGLQENTCFLESSQSTSDKNISKDYIENELNMDKLLDDIIDKKFIEINNKKENENLENLSESIIINNEERNNVNDEYEELQSENLIKDNNVEKLSSFDDSSNITVPEVNTNSINSSIKDNEQENNNEKVSKNKISKTKNLIGTIFSKYFSFDKKRSSKKNKIVEEKGIKPIYPTKDFSLTGKERPNYASSDCAAILLKSNKEAKYANSILNEKKDSYMINECSAKNKFVIVELCNDILIDAIVIGNFELFSSTTKLFKVSVANKFNYHNNKWTTLAYFEAVNSRDIQVFKVDNPIMYARYVRIDFISNYGFESFCPLNLLRIHGITMMEEYKADEYPNLTITEDEVKNNQTENIEESIKDFNKKSENDENKQQINFHLDYLRSKYAKSKDDIDVSDTNPHSLDSLFKQYFGERPIQKGINTLPENSENNVKSENIVNSDNNNVNNGYTQQPVQENVYKTIMRRLTILENNSTASIIYLEEQNKMLSHYFNVIQRLQNLLPLESLTDENIGVASASAVENLQIYLEGLINDVKKIYSKKLVEISIEMLRDKKLYMEQINNATERIERLEKSRNYQIIGLIVIILFSSRVSQIINALHSLIFASSRFVPLSQRLGRNNISLNNFSYEHSNDTNNTVSYNTASVLEKKPLLEEIDNYSLTGFLADSVYDDDSIYPENEIINSGSMIRKATNNSSISNMSRLSNNNFKTSSVNKQEYVRLPKNQQGKSIPDIKIYKNYNSYYKNNNGLLETNSQKRNSLTNLQDLYTTYGSTTNTEIEDKIFSSKISSKSNNTSRLSPLSISFNNDIINNNLNNDINNNNNNNSNIDNSANNNNNYNNNSIDNNINNNHNKSNISNTINNINNKNNNDNNNNNNDNNNNNNTNDSSNLNYSSSQINLRHTHSQESLRHSHSNNNTKSNTNDKESKKNKDIKHTDFSNISKSSGEKLSHTSSSSTLY